MNNNQKKQVIDNTSLVSFIGSRPFHHESSTGFGTTGFGKLGFGEPRWAHAVSKPFGTPFKPKRPLCDGPVMAIHNPVKCLANVKPVVPEPVKAEPVVLVCASGNGFDKDAYFAKALERTRAITQAIDESFKSKVIRKAKPDLTGVIVNRKERSYKPGKVGLDKVREVDCETVRAERKALREREERNNLLLYWMELRSIYRLIYG